MLATHLQDLAEHLQSLALLHLVSPDHCHIFHGKAHRILTFRAVLSLPHAEGLCIKIQCRPHVALLVIDLPNIMVDVRKAHRLSSERILHQLLRLLQGPERITSFRLLSKQQCTIEVNRHKSRVICAICLLQTICTLTI